MAPREFWSTDFLLYSTSLRGYSQHSRLKQEGLRSVQEITCAVLGAHCLPAEVVAVPIPALSLDASLWAPGCFWSTSLQKWYLRGSRQFSSEGAGKHLSVTKNSLEWDLSKGLLVSSFAFLHGLVWRARLAGFWWDFKLFLTSEVQWSWLYLNQWPVKALILLSSEIQIAGW